MKMNCPRCKTKLEVASGIKETCPVCGYSFYAPTKHPSDRKKIYIVGGVVGLLLIIGVFFLIRPKPQQDPKVMQPETLRPAPHVAQQTSKHIPVKFTIGGMRIGDPLTKEFAYNHCPAKDEGKPEIQGFDTIQLDGQKVSIIYYFKNSKLIGVFLLFDSSFFDTMVKTYSEKFGSPPHESTSETIVTGMGVKYLNETVQWETDAGLFKLQKYGSTIKNGYGELMTPEMVKSFQEKENSKVNELKSKL